MRALYALVSILIASFTLILICTYFSLISKYEQPLSGIIIVFLAILFINFLVYLFFALPFVYFMPYKFHKFVFQPFYALIIGGLIGALLGFVFIDRLSILGGTMLAAFQGSISLFSYALFYKSKNLQQYER